MPRGIAQLLTVLALAALITAPMLPAFGWPHTHVGLGCHVQAALFAESLGHGIAYPRWLPDLDGGYGYPTFVFYQPGFFYVAAGFMTFCGSPAAGVYGAILTFLCLGALGAYRIGRHLGDSWTAWFCASLFLLTPYLFVNLFVRGDLTELSAMLIVPWAFWFLLRIVKRVRSSQPVSPDCAGLGAALAGVVYSHPMVGMFATLVLMLVTLGLALQGVRPLRLAFAMLQAGLVGAALMLFYALPMVRMMKFIHYHRAIMGYYSPGNHAVHFLQYFQRDWGFGASSPGPNDAMPFQLGLPHALIAVAGLIAGWTAIYRATFAAYAILVVGATTLFSWAWDGFFPLDHVQFPWRVLSVVATLQVVLACGLHERFGLRPPATRALIYLALLAAILWWCKAQFAAREDRVYDVDQLVENKLRALPASKTTVAGADEFRPKTASGLRGAAPRADQPLVEVMRGQREIAPAPDCTKHRIHYLIQSGDPVDLVINQAYFPGWRVEVGGDAVPAATLADRLTWDGRLTVTVAAREPTSLVAYYAGPPGGGARLLISGALLLAFAGLAWMERAPRSGVPIAPQAAAA